MNDHDHDGVVEGTLVELSIIRKRLKSGELDAHDAIKWLDGISYELDDPKCIIGPIDKKSLADVIKGLHAEAAKALAAWHDYGTIRCRDGFSSGLYETPEDSEW